MVGGEGRGGGEEGGEGGRGEGTTHITTYYNIH